MDADTVDALEFFLVLLDLHPHRLAPTSPPTRRPVIAATDAQADRQPSGHRQSAEKEKPGVEKWWTAEDLTEEHERENMSTT